MPLVALLLGAWKLERQAGSPPRWAAVPDHRYEGHVAIDRFAERAAHYRDWLAGDDPDGRRLVAFLRTQNHPHSVVVPCAVGAVAALLGSVVAAYAAVVGAAFLLALLLTRALARQLFPSLPDAANAATVLLAAHCLSARTVLQLHLDWSAAAAVLGAVVASLAWSRKPGLGRAVVAVLALTAGAFVKISFLPMLLAPVLCAWCVPEPAFRWRWVGQGVLLGLLPLLPLVAWTLWLDGGLALVHRDATHMLAQNRIDVTTLRAFGLEMALLGQILPVWAVSGWRERAWPARAVAAACLVQLLATWAFGLPTLARLYVPVLCLLSVLAAPGLVRAPRRLGLGWVGANVAVAIAAPWLAG